MQNAIQITDDIRNEGCLWPAWLHGRIKAMYGGKECSVYDSMSQLMLVNPIGESPFNIGDYILIGSGGELSRCSPEDFQGKDYEKWDVSIGVKIC